MAAEPDDVGEGREGPWYKPRHLPHFHAGRETQMITYRLGDSLPAHLARRKREEPEPEADTRYRRRIEQLLDRGRGSCALRTADCAILVVGNWQRGNGLHYDLHAWVVMPNHVHILLSLNGTRSLARIVQSWKAYTGRRLPVTWQRDYWDRFVRDERHFKQAVAYIHGNPVVAGLCASPEQWPWSSASGGVGQRG